MVASLGTDFDTAHGELRVLDANDFPALNALLNANPDAYCVVAERVTNSRLEPASSGGPTWGWFEDGELTSAIYVGANVMPIETTQRARIAFADRLARTGRRASAIVGFADEVIDLWMRLERMWGPCREVRADQPLMAVTSRYAGADELVRVVEPVELDQYLPAAVEMFIEEVGVSPVAGGRSAAFRARVGQTIRQGRAYARFDRDGIVFKAEVGSVSAHSAQVQGVWIEPKLRGNAMSAPALGAVVNAALETHARRVSLYANSHNAAALRTYARVGFEQIGTFATVLF